MAMIGDMSTEFGIPLNYHNISALTLNKDNSIIMTVHSFINNTQRFNGASPLRITNYKKENFAGEFSIKNAYVFLMTTEPFNQMESD